jgi:hypothetical protein
MKATRSISRAESGTSGTGDEGLGEAASAKAKERGFLLLWTNKLTGGLAISLIGDCSRQRGYPSIEVAPPAARASDAACFVLNGGVSYSFRPTEGSTNHRMIDEWYLCLVGLNR